MKTGKNIFIAFLLNLIFSIIELIGGLFTNSIAILTDAIHDFCDALSIGLSYFLEKKSLKKPDNNYTYGYKRFSSLSVLITSTILITGSLLLFINSLKRLFNPVNVNYDGMIIIGIFGLIINLIASLKTKGGQSLNEESVHLHMLEDTFGWLIVLIGAFLIKITNINYIDSILSIFLSIFIFFHALKHLKIVIDLFLIHTPNNINIDKIKQELNMLDIKINKLNIWSLDGVNNYATIIVDKDLKEEIRNVLKQYNVNDVVIEVDNDKF